MEKINPRVTNWMGLGGITGAYLAMNTPQSGIKINEIQNLRELNECET